MRHPAYNKNAAGKSVTESSLLNKFKNVAITDSSFTKITDFDHSDEWWCVRQVCPNKKGNVYNFTTTKN